MRKFIFIVLLLLISISTKAQVTLQSYSAARAEWSEYTNNWVWDELSPCGITFIVTENVIEADDVAQSTYYVYSEYIVEKYRNAWRAVDEDGEKCIVGIVIEPKGSSFLYVMYESVMFKYFVK